MIINGESVDLENMNIKELLNNYKLKEDHVVVEVNEIIIEKTMYESTLLDKSSKVEIIAFVGGG